MFKLLFLILILSNIVLANNDQVCSAIQNEDRFDCFPEKNASQDACEKRGCCWSQPHKHKKFSYSLDIPYCYYQ